MTDITFMTDEGFLTIRALRRIRKVLTKEGEQYFSELYKRCGLGLSSDQFLTIVKGLAASDWCWLRAGGLGATIVTINEQVRDASRVVDYLSEAI